MYMFSKLTLKFPLDLLRKLVVIFSLKCLGLLLGIQSIRVCTGFVQCVLCILPFCFNLGICLSLDILLACIFQLANPLFNWINSTPKSVYCILSSNS